MLHCTQKKEGINPGFRVLLTVGENRRGKTEEV
jgi:hypothetical protein